MDVTPVGKRGLKACFVWSYNGIGWLAVGKGPVHVVALKLSGATLRSARPGTAHIGHPFQLVMTSFSRHAASPLDGT